MEAQRGARPSPEKAVLQKSLRPKPCDWVDYRLPFKNPTGHREAKCRIEQMHLSHRHPPIWIDTSLILRGGTNYNLYRHNSNRAEREQGTTVPSKWHGSNRSNQESERAANVAPPSRRLSRGRLALGSGGHHTRRSFFLDR